MRKFLVAACLAVLFVGSGMGAQSALADHGYRGYPGNSGRYYGNYGAPGCHSGHGPSLSYGSYYRPPVVAVVPTYGVGYGSYPFGVNPYGNVGFGNNYPFGTHGYGPVVPRVQLRIGF